MVAGRDPSYSASAPRQRYFLVSNQQREQVIVLEYLNNGFQELSDKLHITESEADI